MEYLFENIPEELKRKAKAATIMGDMKAMKEVSKEIGIDWGDICAGCGANVNDTISQWFIWANSAKKFNAKK